MATLYFALALLACALTLNVYRPYLGRPLPTLFGFLCGWWYGDLAPWVVVVLLLSAIPFALTGSFTEPLGVAGLLMVIGSAGAVLWQYLQGLTLRTHCEAPLREAYGETFADLIPEGLGIVPERFSAWRYVRPFHARLPGVQVSRDLTIASVDGWPVNIDVYSPKERADTPDAPVLLQIHGGGWMENYGDKRTQALPLMNHLAAQGWICVTVDYRLSPAHKWPAHIIDCKRALAWIRNNIADWGGNPDFVVATGGSAGGHLSSLLALTANDPVFQPGFEETDTTVAACIPFYGVYDFSDQHGLHINDGLRQAMEQYVIGKPLSGNEELYRQGSPLHRIHSAAPPFFVVHGSHDSLTSLAEAQLFTEQLRTCSRSEVLFLELPGAQHAFDIFATPKADWCMRAVMLFANYQYGRWLQSAD